MHRIRLTLTLPLLALLLLAQLGATLHELSHLRLEGRSVAARVGERATRSDPARCLTCAAFTQIAHPVAAVAACTEAPRAASLACPDPPFSVIGASAPTPRSRGPPRA